MPGWFWIFLIAGVLFDEFVVKEMRGDGYTNRDHRRYEKERELSDLKRQRNDIANMIEDKRLGRNGWQPGGYYYLRYQAYPNATRYQKYTPEYLAQLDKRIAKLEEDLATKW